MTQSAPISADAVVQQAGDAIIVIDTHGTIEMWNDKAVELFGWDAAQAVGQNVSLMIPEKLRPHHDRAFGAAMVAGHLASDGKARRTKALTAGGGTVYVTMTFAVLNAPDGSAIGSIAVAREAEPRQP